MINLANSLSTYVQSEGRRPDLKVIDDIAKQPNIIPVTGATNEVDTEENKKSHEVPNLHPTDNNTSIQQNSFILTNDNNKKDDEDDLDSDSNASSSDTSDLDEMFQNKQHMRMRPAFNCKKKMISSTSY